MKKIRGARTFAILFYLALSALNAYSGETIPKCMQWSGDELGINNTDVIEWKFTTENQTKNRAHVEGPILRVFPDKNGHEHFAIQIGADAAKDTIEVIYNQEFGAVPAEMKPGMQIEACGDYITSNAPTVDYPASPEGAIVHWVHRAPNLKRHPSGFLVIDGKLYGQDAEHAGPKKPRH